MPYRSIKHVIAGIIALGLLIVSQAICYTPVVAQTAVVRFEPAPLTVGEGMTSAVSIRVENVQKLYGVDVRVSFDPTAVEVVDADESAEGVQVRPGDLLNLDFLARNSADNENGTIWFALSQMNPSEEVTGGGEAFVVTFRGKTKGATSPLEITYVKMSDREGKVIQADKEDSLVDVVDSSNAPATPTTAPTLPSPTLVAPTHPPATATPIRPTATATPIVPTATATSTAAPTDTPVPTNPPTSSSRATQVAQQAFTATPMPALPTDTVAPVQVGGGYADSCVRCGIDANGECRKRGSAE